MKRKVLGLSVLMLLVVAMLAFAVSCGTTPDPVDVASIEYDGATISWAPANNAESYKVAINDVELGTTYSSSIAYTTTENSVKVDITPVGEEDAEGETTSMTFTRLGGGEDMEIYFDEEGNASWDAVTGATAYVVEVNGKQEKITATTYPATAFKLGQQNRIRVKPSATNNSTFSSWSKTFHATYLAAPSNITFDGSRISWKGAAEATAYEIYINENLHQSVEAKGGTSFAYNPDGNSFYLAMKAIGNPEARIFTSPMSNESRYIYLPTVTEFTVDSGTISWPEVADASDYEVKINGSTRVVKESKIENLSVGVDNRISVKPRGTASKDVYYFSEWSHEELVHIIAAPASFWNSELTLDGTSQYAFNWRAVAGVQNYVVKLVTPAGVSEEYTVSDKSINFAHAFEESGEYTISVKAVPSTESGYYESAYSRPIKVVRLATPEAATTGIVTSNNHDIAFNIHLKDQSGAGAIGYTVYKEGIEIVSRNPGNNIAINNVIDDNTRTEQNFTYSVRAIGEGVLNNSTNTVILSSLSSSWLEFQIKVLEAPKNISILGHVVSWDAVQSAIGYTIDGISNATSAQASYSLDAGTIRPGTFDLNVRANGDGRQILSSPVSDTIHIRKLEAPSGLKILTGEQEGTISFTQIDGIDSYELCINGNPDYYDYKTVNNINGYITENSVSVMVRAVADSYDEKAQVYTLTSDFSTPIFLTKLAAPTWPETYHDETSIIWNAPANHMSTPQYQVYNGSSLAFSGSYNKTSFSLENFEGGKQYTFYIRAVGNGTTTLSSDLSEPRTVTKLLEPTVTVAPNRLSYTWRHVTDAQRYVVKIDGIVVATIDAANADAYYSFTPKASHFNKGPSDYSITVTATNDEYIDSNPTLKELTVKKVATPSFAISYDSESFSRTGNIVITVTPADDANTIGYVYNVDGKTSAIITETTYKCMTANTGTYTVDVTAASEKFDNTNDGIFYVNSQAAQTQSLTLLSAPSGNTISLGQDGTLKWGSVDGAIRGYEVYVDYGDGTTSEVYQINSDSTRCDLFDIYHEIGNPDGKFVVADAANYTFYIRAKGNGNKLITSEWVVWDLSQQ